MKILAIGCSFTYGSELPDTELDTFYTKKKPSQLAYPALLAKQLNGTVTNLSLPGGSNGRIFRLVVDQLSKEHYDLVICGWTDHARADFRYDGNDLPATATSSWAFKEFPWIEQYYKVHHDYEQSWQTWLAQLITLQAYLKSRGQKYVFLSMNKPVFGDALTDYQHLIEQVDQSHYMGWPTVGMTTWMGDCPKGPGGHPLELGHQRIAERINEHIRHIGWLP